MASLENRNGNYRAVFRFAGKKYARALGTDNEAEAARLIANLEQTIRDVNNGRMTIPDGGDVVTFLLSDGRLSEPVLIADQSDGTESIKQLTLSELFTLFFDALPEDSLEPSTISQMQTHQRNLIGGIGANFKVDEIDLNALDAYARKRRRAKGRRGRNVGASTIHKELVTLRRVWSWGKKRDKVTGDLPELRDVELPKLRELPPFQTYDGITTQIAQEDLKDAEQQELWECIYLRLSEVDDVLQHVRDNARHQFLFPMFVTAAHTGARRSELLRSRLSDIRDDFIIIREKKRVRGRESTRRVPMSTVLRRTMSEWQADHPGGKHTFTMADLARSTTPLTKNQAHDHFQRVLSNSKWSVIQGWHCLRHSFISNLASQGVDQRLIDEFVGHTTEEMRRRYRHLLPDVKQAAIHSVLG